MNKRHIWQSPWDYKESFIISFSLIIVGFAINFATGTKIGTISWPENLYFGISLIILLFVSYYSYRKSNFIIWLSGTHAAIGSICGYAFLVMIMGFIPQNVADSEMFIDKIGLTSLLTSYAFLFVQLNFIITLGMCTLKRCIPFKRKNIGFFLNHFGLFLALTAATLGAGDIENITLTATKGKIVYSGLNKDGDLIKDLGIAIELKEFKIDQYSPKAYIIDSKSGDVLFEQVFYMEKGSKAKISDWEFEVTEYYKYAVYSGDKFYRVYDYGSAPAAYVIATNTKTKEKKESWVSCGSFRYTGSFLELSKTRLLVMSEPEPKKYSSELKIYTPNSKVIEATVEVNKPITVGNKKIYQLSYDKEKGMWSEISVLNIVSDPWLNVVYLGFFMLIAGALYMFWMGNKKNKDGNI